MNVVVVGGDGYLGWPAALYFSARGHAVLSIDSFVKRRWEAEAGARPLHAIPPLPERIARWHALAPWRGEAAPIAFRRLDVAADYDRLVAALQDFRPHAIEATVSRLNGEYNSGLDLNAG